MAKVLAHICLSDFDQVKSLIDEGVPVTSIDSVSQSITWFYKIKMLIILKGKM